MKMIIALVVTILNVNAMAQASALTELHCNASTRVIAGDLYVKIDSSKNLLSYNFNKYHSKDPSQIYSTSGSNQEGFGYSSLSKSKVDYYSSENGDITIIATGKFYERATPIGSTEITIELSPLFDQQYQLKSFSIDGVKHTLGTSTSCGFDSP